MSFSSHGKTKSLLGAGNNASIESPQIIMDSPSPSEGPLPRNARKKSKLTVFDLMRDVTNRSSLYVLFVLLITYMFNQLDRYLQPITAADMQTDQGWGDGNGEGHKEDILVGAVFTACYLPFGIPMGFLSDRFPSYKKYLLAMVFGIWSLATLLTGFTTSYYQVAIARIFLAIGEAGCTPIAGSIISDHFSHGARTTALGIYNWGIYTGYSLANGVANVLADETNWRLVWWVFGASGLVWTIFVLLIPKPTQPLMVPRASHKSSYDATDSRTNTLCQVVKYFATTPSLIILLTASLIRNAGGVVWAVTAKIFFENVDNESGTSQAMFMQWIPLIGGCFGALLGGFISDRFVARSQPSKRLLILVASNLIASPFAFLVLWLPPPYCYLMLIPLNVIGEMWISITISLVIDLVPNRIKTIGLSIYFSWIGIAGFFPLLVTPLQNLFCPHSNPSCSKGLQWALVVLFPGLYVLSSLIFFASMLFLKRDKKKAKMQYVHAIRLNS
eukprot:172786_1